MTVHVGWKYASVSVQFINNPRIIDLCNGTDQVCVREWVVDQDVVSQILNRTRIEFSISISIVTRLFNTSNPENREYAIL